jgi:solute carrier family 25, member 39/40
LVSQSNLRKRFDADFCAVTPLDVVRVRLQSQTPTPSPLNLSKFPAYTANLKEFKELPPNLGVTACCKEVFFVGNNGDFCLAGSGTASEGIAADCAVEETQRKTFNSTFDGIKKIARNEGPTTLWRGLTPTLAMAVPGNVIYFTGYDWLRYSHMSPIKRLTNDTYAPLVAGSIARVAAGIVVSPIEMFRTRMQATAGHANNVFKDTFSGLRVMTQTQGYTSLWRGLTLTMWRDVPFSGFYWWGYEALRNQLTDAREVARGKMLDSQRSMTSSRGVQNHETHATTFVDSFIAGAGSGAVASVVTTPFDVGKTRQQVYRHAGDDGGAPAQKTSIKPGVVSPEERSMPRFLYHIFKEEGVRGLFKGWVPRCLKVAPACAIMISSYEVGKRWAKTRNEKKAITQGEARKRG